MIGYYAHHVGSGHLHRAAAVAAHLGPRMTVLSSAESPVAIDQVRLSRDDEPPIHGDVTAAQSLHWVPLRNNGLRERTSQIVRWAEQQNCSVLVSDVSVEVLLLARLLSIPPVAVALRGKRMDRAHALGYDVAATIIAPWPRVTHGRWPQRWLDKTVWVGPVSRFDGRARARGRCGLAGRCVVLMLGRGGDSMTEAVLREAAAVPDTHWHLLGTCADREPVRSAGRIGAAPESAGIVERLGWLADPWPMLCRADVVVAAPGDAAIADVAAAGRPLIAVPQHRPFGEQEAQASALVRHRLCLSVPTWPDRQSWPRLLDRAQSLGGSGWSAYYDGRGSARMAAAMLEVAEAGRGGHAGPSAVHDLEPAAPAVGGAQAGASAVPGGRQVAPSPRLPVG